MDVRYRQDVSREADWESVAEHVRLHLAGAVDHNDDPSPRRDDVTVGMFEHFDGDVDLVTILGEIDGEPDAPYLRPDFDPDADHPEITFTPFEQPDLGRHADHQALESFRAGAR